MLQMEDQRKQSLWSVLRAAADSVLPWLEFTGDIPENHPGGTVPALDLQLWVEHPEDNQDGLESDILMWKFYEKPIVSSRVLRSTSAFTWRNKLVTLSMETFRRMRNCSRQLSTTTRALILCNFVDKLRRSGYSEKTTRGSDPSWPRQLL